MTLLLRVILVVVVAAIVLAIAYVVVTDPGSGTDVTARGHRSPVQAQVGHAVELGRGRAVMASGPAGLWVARQPPTGSPGEVERIDTDTGKPEHAYRLNILPQGIAVGHGVIWVLGSKRADGPATLLRIDPASGRVQHRLQLAEQSSCATAEVRQLLPGRDPRRRLGAAAQRNRARRQIGRDGRPDGAGERPRLGSHRERSASCGRWQRPRSTGSPSAPRPPADRPHDERGRRRAVEPRHQPTATRCGSRATRATPPRTPVA